MDPFEHADAILALAADVYSGLSEEDIAEIEEMSRRRDFPKKLSRRQ